MLNAAVRLQPWRVARRLIAAFRTFAGAQGSRAVLLVAVGAVLEGAGLMLLAPILTMVTAADSARPLTRWLSALGIESADARLGALVALFIGVMSLRAVALHARDIALARLQTGFVEAQRNRVIRALAGARWARVASLRHARVANLMSAEMQRLGSSVQFLIQGSVALVMLVIQGALAFWLAPELAGFVLLLLAAGALLLVFGQRRSRDLGIEVVQASQALMGSAVGFLNGLKTAAAQNAQAGFVAEFESIQTQLRSRQLEFTARQAKARAIYGIASATLGGAVVVAGFTLFDVAPATLILLIVILVRMSGPALLVQQATQSFFFGVGGFEMVEALTAELSTEAPGTAAGATRAVSGGAPIQFDAVSYLHEGGGGVREVTLAIQPGEFVGITGPSGAGKTTLIDLLVGLVHPQRGQVRIGEIPLDTASAPAWQGRIAYVPQDGFLFHDTLRRNLTWDNAAIDDAAIDRALAIAGASALVERLPQGLETMLGERGTLLSGGERQRIGIARALLRGGDLLVLDEATNAIDPAGEHMLLTRIATLRPRPTIVMITHRADSLGHCDRVFQVRGAVVTERADSPSEG